MRKLSVNMQRKAKKPALSLTLPAPYGGLNLLNGDEIAPHQASELVNFLPKQGACSIRAGYTAYFKMNNTSKWGAEWGVFWYNESVKPSHALFYNEGKLLAFTDDEAHEVYPNSRKPLASGFAGKAWKTAIFKQYLFLVNGVDIPLRYDGNMLENADFTFAGLNVNKLVNVAHVRGRVFFCEKGSADIYYSNVEAVTGGLSKFQSSQLVRAKQCVAIAQLSHDDGDGQDDNIAIIFDSGEILVYGGDISTSFTLVGKYETEQPIGYNCVLKVSGDVIIITKKGIIPLTQIMQGVDVGQVPMFNLITPIIEQEAYRVSDLHKWQGFKHDGLIYISMPPNKQLVLNTQSSAWTLYDYPALAFAYSQTALYFSNNNKDICKVGGVGDDGAVITAIAKTAFVKIGGEAKFTQAMPIIQAKGYVGGRIGVDTDYLRKPLNMSVKTLISSISTTQWGNDWASKWAASINRDRDKRVSIRGHGRNVSAVLELHILGQEVSFKEMQLIYERGDNK